MENMMNDAVASDALANAQPNGDESRVLYTARVHTDGGREGAKVRSVEGSLDVWLSLPGRPGSGTNPEQLFAAAWSASFESALWMAAKKIALKFPAKPIIDTEVDLALTSGLYSVGARLNVKMPGVPDDLVHSLIAGAAELCPYSRILSRHEGFRISSI
jgi:Ohr subfamily peroxiredoxin